MLPVYVEAEYADGYVHREDEQDHSPFVSGANIFSDILENRPAVAHGPMMRFSLVLVELDQRHDVDWLKVPANARPIRFKHMERQIKIADGEWAGPPEIVGIDFGYQWTEFDPENPDDQTKWENKQEVIEIR